MATDDLKAELRDAVAFGYMPAATRQVLDKAYGKITTLEAQLAARDAEIAAWLRGEADRWKTDGCNPVAAMALFKAATAIASGDYAKGQTDE